MVVYKTFLSLLNILIAFVKIFDYSYRKYDTVILYQNYFIIFLHLFLIQQNNCKAYNRFGFEENKLQYVFKKVGVLIIALLTLQMMDFGFIFNYVALILDVLTTYAHFLIYKEDPQKPVELFFAWIFGDFIKLYFNTFVYKTPLFYTFAIITQLVFDVLTIFSATKVPIDVVYN